MNRSAIGWIFVAVQAVLLITLIILPGRNDWATPRWLEGLGMALVVAGVAVVGLAALRLGPALTPTPMPSAHGQLATTGFYRYVRHPIYSGVFLVVIGLALRSGSWIAFGLAVLTLAFFNVKAGWEEARLAETYADYPAYAATTPRFLPRLGVVRSRLTTPWRRRSRRRFGPDCVHPARPDHVRARREPLRE